MTTGVRSGTGLTRVIGLCRTRSIKLRQAETNNEASVGQPRRIEGSVESQP